MNGRKHRKDRRRTLPLAAVLGVVAGTLWSPGAAPAQELADFDYENLSFRGIGAEWGRIYPTRVVGTETVAVRFDLGYLGPGLRIVPSVAYWRSPFKDSEVAGLEESVAELIADQVGGPPPAVDLGTITWTDVAVSVDAHVVWALPLDVLTFIGVGASSHILNGSGTAIDDTFVEDLLDSATAGFNLHGGVEYPVVDRVRIFGQARYEVLGDLQYLHAGMGVMLMFGGLEPAERRR